MEVSLAGCWVAASLLRHRNGDEDNAEDLAAVREVVEDEKN